MLLFSLLAFVGVVRAQVETILPEDVEESAFGTNGVTDGTNFYATLQAAVEAVAGKANSTLYCKPGADVGSLQHAPVTATLTVYGNGAYVSGGSERDFDLGNSDPSGGKDITADMTLTVKNLDGCGAWGTKATEHTVNVVFENCKNMFKVFITGTTGTLNISMTDCAFEGAYKEALYSNADGNITLTNVAFSNLNKAVNLNHKAAGTQTVTINGCSFTNCGADIAQDQILVRVLSSVHGGKTVLNVSNATFTGTPEGGADILLDYGVGETTASVTATAANVFVEKENNVATKTTVTESEGGEFTNVVPVAKIGEVEYFTFSEAVAAANADETIVLLSNVECAEKPVFTKGGVVNVDVNGFVFESNDYNRVRNVASADGTVESNNIKFVNGFGWEVYNANGSTSVAGTNFHVFPTLSEAVSYKPSEKDLAARIYPYQENIKLDADVTLRATTQGTASTICVDPGYTVNLDLNGYTVLQESPTGNPLEACIRGNFVLDDTSDAKTGKWIAGACGVTDPSNSWYGNGGPAFYVLGDGCVTLKGGEVSIARNNGVDVLNTGGLIRLDSGSLIVDGATLNVDDTYGIMAWGGSVTVNSGDFVMGTNGTYSVFAMKYYADASVMVNSAIDGYLLVHSSASAVVNVAGVKYYASGNDYVAPSVGEGLVAQGGVVGRPVAKIGEQGYVTLQAAIEAVQEGETITLIDNVVLAERVTIPADKTLTIDLNGKSISMEESIIATAYAINNLGNLTITDGVGGGSINARGIYNGYGDGGANVATAKITVVSGTINAKGTNGGGAAIFNYGVADIQGGTFTSVASYAIALQTGSTMTIGENAIITGGINSWQSTLTITGGTISNDKSGKHVVYAGESAVTINGGTFHNNNSGNATIMASGSTAAVEITGGTFTLNIVDASSSYLIDATSSATYTISGGSFTGGIRAQGGTKYEITGGTFTNEYGNYNVYEGGDINISGGTFTGSYAQKFATDNLAAGYELNADGTVVAKPVAEVNGVKYATFAEAVAAAHKATDKVTITLKKDITVSAAISINKLVTIDLNGKAISSAEGYVFEVTGGELVLQGEGSIGAICYIINDADYKAADKTFALTENKNNVDIVYNRTFGHTSWQVLYVPFAIPVENMEGFEVYSISNVTDSGVVIEQVVEGDLSANTPYIIKATEAGDKTIKVTGATLSLPVAYEETIGNFTINGTYSSMAIDAESQYVLTNGLWCQLSQTAVDSNNNILGAFRVYLTANGENTPSEVRFVINNSDATAIDELKAENGNVKAEVYDLSGRRVEKAVKGIYVVNGVKVIK